MIQLYLANAADGVVWWDGVTLEEIPDSGTRHVRVAPANLQPRGTKSSEENASRFLETIDERILDNVDVIMPPEGITIVGLGGNFPPSLSQSLDRPRTDLPKQRALRMPMSWLGSTSETAAPSTTLLS